jgi:2OG-Fe(II) oxygenase superfamily
MGHRRGWVVNRLADLWWSGWRAGTPPRSAFGGPEPFDDYALARLTNIQDYQAASPYPHLVMDDFFNPRCLDRICAEWPDPAAQDLGVYNDDTYVVNKKATTYRTTIGHYTNFVLHRLCEPRFLEALERVTGIDGLIPDPYRRGGGLQFTTIGGQLAIHADFNKHFKYDLDRRLNLIVYLNHGWLPENGGCLELWDKEMNQCQRNIVPVFNRMVLFSTSKFSYHGHPTPVMGPRSLQRRSIAVYYYSNGRPEDEAPDGKHETRWQIYPGRETYL